MLLIKYKQPTHTDEKGKQYFLIRGIRWSEANEEKVKQLGYEYSIVEHEPRRPAKPSLGSRVGTLETDSTEMKEALDMILSGVTE